MYTKRLIDEWLLDAPCAKAQKMYKFLIGKEIREDAEQIRAKHRMDEAQLRRKYGLVEPIYFMAKQPKAVIKNPVFEFGDSACEMVDRIMVW